MFSFCFLSLLHLSLPCGPLHCCLFLLQKNYSVSVPRHLSVNAVCLRFLFKFSPHFISGSLLWNLSAIYCLTQLVGDIFCLKMETCWWFWHLWKMQYLKGTLNRLRLGAALAKSHEYKYWSELLLPKPCILMYFPGLYESSL